MQVTPEAAFANEMRQIVDGYTIHIFQSKKFGDNRKSQSQREGYKKPGNPGHVDPRPRKKKNR